MVNGNRKNILIKITSRFYAMFRTVKQSYRLIITEKPLLAAHLKLLLTFILIVLLVIFTEKNHSSFKMFLYLPVIFYSLKFGARWGYLISALSGLLIACFYFIPPEKNALNIEADLILLGTFFLLSWLVGNVIALERSFKSQLSELVVRDELTGLYNYRYFQQQLQKMIEDYRQDGSKIGLIMIDLDNFKLYNETMGNFSGNILLRTVSDMIRSNLDKGDFAVRYGGDEFIVVTPFQESSQVINKAEKIRKEINTISEETLGSEWRLSASLGIALFPDQAKDRQSLLQKADEALYKAKITNGNRVQLYYSIFDRLSGKMLNKEKEFLSTVRTLMAIINARDRFTFNHSERVLVYAQAICRELRLTTSETVIIEYAAFLHDIGKIEIGRDILNKSSPLTERERRIWEQHPLWGAEIIKPLKEMEPVLPAIIHHHERFDGKGYPQGLKGKSIPLGARIIHVANAFDLFTAEFPLHEGKGIKEGIEYLKKGSDILFDPQIVEVFTAFLSRHRNVFQLLEWPRDLGRLVPAGYFPGSFLMGCQYFDFYSGNFHFIIKTTAYVAAAIINNEKCLYYTDEKKEELLLKEIKKYYYRGTPISTVLRKNQLNRMVGPEELLKIIHRRAKLEFETRKFFMQLKDEALKEGFISLRVILDGALIPLSERELVLWEKNLSRCIKDLEIVVICLYNIDEENVDMCRFLEDLHDKPLLNRE